MKLPNARRLVVASLVFVAALSAPFGATAAKKPIKRSEKSAAANGDVRWATYDKLVEEAKYSEAADEAKKLRATAIQSKDDALWQKTLVEEVRLRDRQGESSQALRLVRDEAWPDTKSARLERRLLWAQTLQSYLRRYRWEIRKRERIEAKSRLPIEKMSADQIFQELAETLDGLWSERATWADESNETVPSFVVRNDYPKDIRGTLRDTVTYLIADALADTSFWSPAETNEVTQLSLDRLLEGTGPEMPGLANPALHPLLRVSLALRDLESWHRAAGRLDAALEAKLERYRRVRASVAEPDKKRVTNALEKRLVAFKKVEWWSAGIADVAGYRRDEGRFREAHRLATEGAEENPETPGGDRCLHLVKALEKPTFRFEGMQVDGAKKRSLVVYRRNVKTLHFRAYALPRKFLEERSRTRWQLLPTQEIVPSLLKKTPDATWQADFPEARDFGEHRSYVTPPMETPGLYVILASFNPSPDATPNVTLGTVFQVSDYVLTRESQSTGPMTFSLLKGSNGEPVAGAKIELFTFNWDSKPPQRAAKLETDAEGRATYTPKQARESFFAIAEAKGADGKSNFVVDPEVFSSFPRGKDTRQERGFFYTDRAIYRPAQPLEWKLVVVRQTPGSSELAPSEGKKLKVDLCDGNGDVVRTVDVKTDAYGTAAGKFVIPTGKLLGTWSLRASEGLAYANVSVEEYKRPTFEVTLAGATEAVRLNQPATVGGEARYYFGMVVGDGQVKWRVTREPVLPLWWGWCGLVHRWRSPVGEAQTIAAGVGKLDETGRFQVPFLPKADERPTEGDDVSYRFVVTVDVTDPGGETRSASREYRLGTASVTTSIELGASFFTADAGGNVTFRRANLDGIPRRGKGTWRVVSLVAPPGGPSMPADEKPSRRPDLPKPPRQNREDDVDGDDVLPRWTPYGDWTASLAGQPDGGEVFRGALEHGEDGNAVVALPKLSAGAYRIRYDGEDDFGKKVKSWRDFVVAGPAPLPVPAMLEVDRTSAEPGEKIQVLAASGFADQTFTFEVWRDGVLQKRERVQGGDATPREITVTDADRGGFTLVLTMLRDHQVIRLVRNVTVPWTDRMLGVEFESFRDKMRPGGKETWTLRVKAPKAGAKESTVAAAQVLAFMYDRSLDAFRPHSMLSPLALLPTRTGAPSFATPLEAASFWSYRFDDLFPAPPFPTFRSDAFEQSDYVEGYGRLRYADSSGGLADRMMPPPAAAPSLARAKKRSQEADSETDGASLAEAAPTPAQPTGAKNAETPPSPSGVRTKFAETAFWFPQLLSAADGSVKLQFTVPDSVTSWRVMAHALTKDLKYGSSEKTVRTVKELMARPYLPRFVREGDSFVLRVAVNNAGEKRLEGKVRLDLLDADTQKSVAKDFDHDDPSQEFSLKPGASTEVRFSLKAPKRVGPVAVRVVAKAADLSDGEMRPMPLLPSRLHLVESRFATLRDGQKRVLKFEALAKDDDSSRIDEKMVLTLDGQLFTGVLKALPYLVKYPYECLEQTMNRFLSTSLVGAVLERHPAIAKAARTYAKRTTPYVPFDATDPNRKALLEETPWLVESRGGKPDDHEWSNMLDAANVRRERESALDKLRNAQKADGGFPWFAGGPASDSVTLYLLNGFARAATGGVAVPKEMVQRAWQYLAREVRQDLLPRLRENKKENLETAAFLAFVATSFPDATWTEGGLTKDEVNELVDAVFAHWKTQSKYVKAYLAWTLKRQERLADARLVLGSVLDAAKTEPDRGTFWAPEERAWLWYQDTVESHAFLLRTTLEIEPNHPKADGMALWLFLNRKLNHWKSTRATAEAIYALLKFVEADRTLGGAEKYRIEAGDLKEDVTFAADAVETTARFVIPGDKIVPRKTSTVTFESKSRAFALAQATWHFSTERLPAEAASDFFSVNRAYFLRESTPTGVVLKPLADGASVRVGDEVEVQLTLKTKHAAEYVHLRDPRGAGFEPEGAVSGYRWNLGAGGYEEYRDSATNFFFERLPAGEYPFRYRLRAATAGKFRVGPATVQSMYAPEFAAYSSGVVLPVKE